MTVDFEAESNRNLVYSFMDQLTALRDGGDPRALFSTTGRRTLSKHGIIRKVVHGRQGHGVELTEYGQRLLREAQRHGGDA